MIKQKSNSACMEARLFYYDCLSERAPEDIPADILTHLRECRYCQNEMDRLKKTLSTAEHTEAPAGVAPHSDVNQNLNLHFACLDQPITCGLVKPFLAVLAIEKFHVGIPTPINAHIDHCPNCANDLEYIRRLRLNHSQLCRLARLFSETPAQDPAACAPVQKYIDTLAGMNFKDIPTVVLHHVCTCAACRTAWYEARDARRQPLTDAPPAKPYPCEEIRKSDLFDLIVPYGLDPVEDAPIGFRDSLISHLSDCPTCFDKLQDLHNHLYTVMERADSDIITCFEVQPPEDNRTETDSNNIYADWPIAVKLMHPEHAPTVSSASPAAPMAKRHPISLLGRRLIKPAAAAAVLLIIFSLFFYSPAAKAIRLDSIYEALKNTRHVHVQSFNADETVVFQELWVSRFFNIYIIKTGDEWVLWDIPAGTRTTKNMETSFLQVDSVEKTSLERVDNKIATFIDLLPFPEKSLSTEEFYWQQVTNIEITDNIPDTEVYDLTWFSETYSGLKQTNKWRGFIDSDNYLPQRVEWYIKLDDQSDFTLNGVSLIEYLDDNAVEAIIKTVGF